MQTSSCLITPCRKLSFLTKSQVGNFVEIQLIIYVWVYFWHISSIAFIYMFFHKLFLVRLLKYSIFFLRTILTILGLWHFHVNLNLFFKFLPKRQKVCGEIFIFIALIPQLDLKRLYILIISSFPDNFEYTMNLVYSVIYLHFILFLSAMLSFQFSDPAHLLLNLTFHIYHFL